MGLQELIREVQDIVKQPVAGSQAVNQEHMVGVRMVFHPEQGGFRKLAARLIKTARQIHFPEEGYFAMVHTMRHKITHLKFICLCAAWASQPEGVQDALAFVAVAWDFSLDDTGGEWKDLPQGVQPA